MSKKAKSLGTIPIEAIEEFVRACGKDLLSNEDIPDEMPRDEYNKLANAVLERRIATMKQQFVKKAGDL